MPKKIDPAARDRAVRLVRELLSEYPSVTASIAAGRTGSCHDNAVAESWFSVLKNEMY